MSASEWVADRTGEWIMVIIGVVGMREEVTKFTRSVVGEVRGELLKVVEMCFKLKHEF